MLHRSFSMIYFFYDNEMGNNTMKKLIKSTLAVLLAAVLVLSFAGCGSSASSQTSEVISNENSAAESLRSKFETESEPVSEPEEPEDSSVVEEPVSVPAVTTPSYGIAGHYEMDRREAARSLGGEEDLDNNYQLMLINGYTLQMDVDDDGTFSLRLGIPSAIYTGRIDLDNMKIIINETNETLDLAYADDTFTFTSDDVTFIMEKVNFASVFPFEESSRRGYAGIGYFDIPLSWADKSELSDPANQTIKYQANGYSVMSYIYTPEEMESYGVTDYTLDDWAAALTGTTADNYADILASEDYYDSYFNMTTCKECDLQFTDGSALHSFIFIDDDGILRYVSLETLTQSATDHLDEFIQYVRDGYCITQ